MKGHHKHLIGYIFISFFWLFFAVFFNTNTIYASEPAGLPIKDYLSVYDPVVVNPDNGTNLFKTNSAQFLNTDTGQLTDGSGSTESSGILEKTINTNMGTYGALWSNEKNRWDLSQKQSISAWLYFGPYDNNPLANGDGLAFVLQNDIRKGQAMGTGLQGLGVYGWDLTHIDDTVKPATPNIIANTSIRNSVALEFDTNLNKVTDDASPTELHYKKGILGIKSDQYFTSHAFDSTVMDAGNPSDFFGITS